MEPFLEDIDEAELRKKTALEALSDVKRYIFWGLFWSFVLLASAKLLDMLQEAKIENWAWKIIIAARYILEHLGIGFIVSTVAVYFYEWGSHARRLTDISVELLRELKIQRKIGERQEHLRIALKGDRSALDAINGLIKSLVELGDPSYKDIVLRLLNGVRKNAAALSSLDHVNNSRFIGPPAAATIVDSILSAHMNALNAGDTYQVVSDLASWQEGRLPRFREATRIAVTERGASVQRVFNILNEDRYALSASAAAAILRRHLDDVEAWSGGASKGSYSLRVFGDSELRKAEKDERQDVQGKHFGNFFAT